MRECCTHKLNSSLHLPCGSDESVRQCVAGGLCYDPAFPVPELGHDAAASVASGYHQHLASQSAVCDDRTRGEPQPIAPSLWVQGWRGLSVPDDTDELSQPASDQHGGLQSRLRRQTESNPPSSPVFDLHCINQQIVSFISSQQICLELPKYGKAQKKKVSKPQLYMQGISTHS